MDTALPCISPRELNQRIGRPGAPLLLDVRRTPVFSASPHLLAGASHCAPEDVARLAASGPARDVVVYCHYGHEVGQEAAQTLRQAGWNARYLQGGMAGGEAGSDSEEDIAAWRAVRPLRMRKRADLGVTGEGASRWITRARPKIDRVACPWLILRFIDPGAQFFYVPTEQVFAQARKLEAVAFDIEGAPISHEGEQCSFDALLAAFELKDPALQQLASIVRGADTDRLSLTPQSAGLLAVSLGLSQMHPDDDQAMLRAALPVYDALYAWCREARGESHGWKALAEPAP